MTSTPRFRACSIEASDPQPVPPRPPRPRTTRGMRWRTRGPDRRPHPSRLRARCGTRRPRRSRQASNQIPSSQNWKDLEHVREALLRVGERLHPRRRIAVLLVPPHEVTKRCPVSRTISSRSSAREALVVAERRPQPDALAAKVLADQLGRDPQLLAERHRRRLGKHRLGVRALRRGSARPGTRRGCRCAAGGRRAASPRAARSRRGVQQRPPAEKEGARRLELLVQAREQADAAARRVRVERGAVLRHVRADEPREPLADRGGLVS